MKVYVFIVTYNRLSLLKKTINSLRKQTYPIDNLCVINNGSTDGTYEWLLEQQDLTVIHQENLGGAGGFSRGVQYAYSVHHSLDNKDPCHLSIPWNIPWI